jgi:hypothetical protein
MDSEILIYQTENGNTNIEVRLEEENVWLSQQQMATLFQVKKQNISYHLGNIFKDKELDERSVVKFFLTTASDGKTYNVLFYNLDVIISIGYRVKSHIGTQFRIWATQRINDFLVKGFLLDDERIKYGGQSNYFQELLDRIRDIRSSERFFYQKVKDIFTTSIDYDPKTDLSKDFFSIVQNKMHWAVHQHTAAELIAERADANKENMGLTNWRSAKVRKSDTSVAKNYLSEEELKKLNLLVEQYLAFAESQALSKKPMYMQDWAKKLNDIITINGMEILEDAGRISNKLAEELAEKEYVKFKTRQQQIEKQHSLTELENDLKLLQQQKKIKK